MGFKKRQGLAFSLQIPDSVGLGWGLANSFFLPFSPSQVILMGSQAENQEARAVLLKVWLLGQQRYLTGIC